MNWAYLLIIEGLILAAVLNVIIYGIYKLTTRKNKED